MSDARILDRGYRGYEGPVRGVGRSVTTVALHTAQRVLGLKRSAGAKVLPVLAATIAYVPAIVFVGLAAFLPDDLVEEGILPSYGEYYGFITAAIAVFVAFVAPEALCPDRRTGMLSLYLASPLDRDTYLLAKAAAVGGLLGLVTLGPPLFLVVAFTMEGSGPAIVDLPALIGRILAAGAVLTVVYGSLSMAVSSLTTRRAAAAAGVILVLLVSGSITSLLVEELDGPTWVWGFNVFSMPIEAVIRIFGEETDGGFEDVATGLVVAANVAWAAVAIAVTRWRHQRFQVTR